MKRLGLLVTIALALGACESKKDGDKAEDKAAGASKAFDPNQRLDKAGEGLTDAEKKELEAAKRKLGGV